MVAAVAWKAGVGHATEHCPVPGLSGREQLVVAGLAMPPVLGRTIHSFDGQPPLVVSPLSCVTGALAPEL